MLKKAKTRFCEEKCVITTESEMVEGKSSHLGGFFVSFITSLSLFSQGSGSQFYKILRFTHVYSSIYYVHIDFTQNMHFLLLYLHSAPARFHHSTCILLDKR